MPELPKFKVGDKVKTSWHHNEGEVKTVKQIVVDDRFNSGFGVRAEEGMDWVGNLFGDDDDMDGFFDAAFFSPLSADSALVDRETPDQAKPASRTFWFVWNVGGGNPRHKHRSEESARVEAERLARKCPGQTFAVLQAIGECRSEIEPPKWAEMSPDAPEESDTDWEPPF